MRTIDGTPPRIRTTGAPPPPKNVTVLAVTLMLHEAPQAVIARQGPEKPDGILFAMETVRRRIPAPDGNGKA